MQPTLAARIRTSARISGHFVLRSGLTSDTYFDKYQFESDPALLRAIAEAMAPLVPPDTDILAKLKLYGMVPDLALCVIDRQSGGAEALQASGLTLRAAFNFAEIEGG